MQGAAEKYTLGDVEESHAADLAAERALAERVVAEGENAVHEIRRGNNNTLVGIAMPTDYYSWKGKDEAYRTYVVRDLSSDEGRIIVVDAPRGHYESGTWKDPKASETDFAADFELGTTTWGEGDTDEEAFENALWDLLHDNNYMTYNHTDSAELDHEGANYTQQVADLGVALNNAYSALNDRITTNRAEHKAASAQRERHAEFAAAGGEAARRIMGDLFGPAPGENKTDAGDTEDDSVDVTADTSDSADTTDTTDSAGESDVTDAGADDTDHADDNSDDTDAHDDAGTQEEAVSGEEGDEGDDDGDQPVAPSQAASSTPVAK